MSKLDQLRQVAQKVNSKVTKATGSEQTVVSVASDIVGELDLGFIPTGNPAVDLALGGGLLRGVMSQVAGREGTGKTCFALDVVAHNQKIDPDFVAILAFTEGPVPYHQMLNAGIDISRVLILSTAGTGLTGERVLEVIMNLLADIKDTGWKPRNLADLIVLDSVAALLPSRELVTVSEEGLNKDTVGRQAAMLSKFMRIFFGTGCLGKSHLLLINQKRAKIDTYGGGESLPGGNAVLYYPKVIIDVRANRGDYVKEGVGDKQKIVGQVVKGEVIKNNTGVGHPHNKFEYLVTYGKGVDPIPAMVNVLVDSGVVTTNAVGWFFWQTAEGVQDRIRGKENFTEKLRQEPQFLEYLTTKMSAVNNAVVQDIAGEPEISLEEINASGVLEELDPAETFAM